MRWPLQPSQPLQQTQIQPPFGQSVDSLCHPWFTTSNLSYGFPILKLPPLPCGVLLATTIALQLVYLALHQQSWSLSLVKTQFHPQNWRFFPGKLWALNGFKMGLMGVYGRYFGKLTDEGKFNSSWYFATNGCTYKLNQLKDSSLQVFKIANVLRCASKLAATEIRASNVASKHHETNSWRLNFVCSQWPEILCGWHMLKRIQGYSRCVYSFSSTQFLSLFHSWCILPCKPLGLWQRCL